MTEKKRVQGMLLKRSANAPSFVITSVSFKVEDFKKFLDENAENGWVNLQMKKSKEDKIYVELDTWKPTGEKKDGGVPF
jgi:hypothetical protein